jgi:hypothetical protein
MTTPQDVSSSAAATLSSAPVALGEHTASDERLPTDIYLDEAFPQYAAALNTLALPGYGKAYSQCTKYRIILLVNDAHPADASVSDIVTWTGEKPTTWRNTGRACERAADALLRLRAYKASANLTVEQTHDLHILETLLAGPLTLFPQRALLTEGGNDADWVQRFVHAETLRYRAADLARLVNRVLDSLSPHP